jgi:hypothetical protein
MLGQTTELFALADVDYRYERIAHDFPRSPRPFHLKWPVGLLNAGKHRRRPTTPRPAPHHLTTVG